MVTKKKVVISIDPEVHSRAMTLLKASGMKYSSFVEIITAALLDSVEKPFKAMCEDMTERFVQEAIGVKGGKKKAR